MKKLLSLAMLLLPILTRAQVATLVAPSNNNYAGLEKNMLFYAQNRFTVTQSGYYQFIPSYLFDGKYDPSYIGPPSTGTPTVVLIEDLPPIHTQKVACIGWTTRYWPPTRFKIEGYDIHLTNGWMTIADITGHNTAEYITTLYGTFTKLRFTFYDGTGPNGELGISELFYLHGEAAQAYEALLVKYDENNNIYMGTNARPSNLAVNGNITTQKVKVTQQGWSDFVFDSTYQLPAIRDVEQFIKTHKHLPEIPPAQQVAAEGVDIGDITARLLQKIEELTLYMIDQHKKVDTLIHENHLLKEQVQKLEHAVRRR